jgi:two-component system phosphate regulon response regulator PhoB
VTPGQADREAEPGGILVVEDEGYLRGLIRLALERAGYRVRDVADGEAALEAVARQRPDLILLDIDLPGIDGFAVCQRLKADPATTGIRILMLTAMSEEADRERGLQVGADGYVAKPFGPFALLARIRDELTDA